MQWCVGFWYWNFDRQLKRMLDDLHGGKLFGIGIG